MLLINLVIQTPPSFSNDELEAAPIFLIMKDYVETLCGQLFFSHK
jgi:hypothetical protein